MNHPSKKRAGGLSYIEVPGDPEGAYVLLMHGFGADAEDLVSLCEVFSAQPKVNWIFPEGPLEIPFGPDYVGRAWFPIRIGDDFENSLPESLERPRNQIIHFLTELRIPLHRLFIGGFSQGAILACDVAFHLPSKIGGLLLLSGTMMHGFEWQKVAASQSSVPFLLTHGRKDTILPFNGAEQLGKLLNESGLSGKLFEFPGGHEIPESVLEQMQLFLKAHVK